MCIFFCTFASKLNTGSWKTPAQNTYIRRDSGSDKLLKQDTEQTYPAANMRQKGKMRERNERKNDL